MLYSVQKPPPKKQKQQKTKQQKTKQRLASILRL